MDNKNSISETPKSRQIRHLGLRRLRKDESSKPTGLMVTPNTVESTSQKGFHNLSNSSSPAYASTASSQSASKLDATISTPSTSGGALRRLHSTTDCRPYRHSLSKNIREKLAKKRLEFKIPNELENKPYESPIEVKMQTKNIDEYMSNALARMHDMTREELIVEIEWRNEEIAAHEAHKRKVQELKDAIEVWKRGFRQTFCDLHAKIEPHLEKSELLQKIGISPEMLQYVLDENGE